MIALTCEKCGRRCALEARLAPALQGDQMIAHVDGEPVPCPVCLPQRYWLLPAEPDPGFARYLKSDDARQATALEIEQLARLRLNPDDPQVAEAYAEIRAVLAAAGGRGQP